jgi:hypothetical protein
MSGNCDTCVHVSMPESGAMTSECRVTLPWRKASMRSGKLNLRPSSVTEWKNARLTQHKGSIKERPSQSNQEGGGMQQLCSPGMMIRKCMAQCRKQVHASVLIPRHAVVVVDDGEGCTCPCLRGALLHRLVQIELVVPCYSPVAIAQQHHLCECMPCRQVSHLGAMEGGECKKPSPRSEDLEVTLRRCVQLREM